jgi:glycosyltransferase involved in cell wall biosynthesis
VAVIQPATLKITTRPEAQPELAQQGWGDLSARAVVTTPHICVVVPVYNHGGTVMQVVRESQRMFPVIVVDDGSTDQGPAVLSRERGIILLTLPANRGKAAALRIGFAKAAEAGFTHAITIDADGQHAADSLADFAFACQEQPDALVVGVRDLKAANAPWVRRLANMLSAFWFRFETGLCLSDTQCGYRAYPLAVTKALRVNSERYAFELEILVRAAWAGVPLRTQSVQADYAAATSRLSHFQPVNDLFRIFRLHARLAAQALCRTPWEARHRSSR